MKLHQLAFAVFTEDSNLVDTLNSFFHESNERDHELVLEHKKVSKFASQQSHSGFNHIISFLDCRETALPQIEHLYLSIRSLSQAPIVLLDKDKSRSKTIEAERIQPLDWLAIEELSLDRINTIVQMAKALTRTRGIYEREAYVERIICDIAQSLSSASGDLLNAALIEALGTIARFTNTDRCNLWLYSKDRKHIRLSHSWPKIKHEADYQLLKSRRTSSIPWLSEQISSGHTVSVPILSHLGAKAEADISELIRDRIQSFTAVPLEQNKEIFGYLELASEFPREKWEHEVLSVSQRFAEIISGVIQRIGDERYNSERLKSFKVKAEETEARFYNVIESLSEGIAISDPEGFIIETNQRFAQIAEMDKSAIIGKRVYDVFIPQPARQASAEVEAEYHAYVERMHERYLDRSRGIAEHYESTIFRANGDQRWLETRAAPLRDTNSEIVGSISVNTDVTEQRHLEEQLRWSQKMEAVGRLAGGVAHDFNNLLTVISGYSNFLLKEIPTTNKCHAYVDSIREASDAACSLTQQLLTVSKRQVIQDKVINVNDILQQSREVIARLSGKKVDCSIKLDPKLPLVKIDPNQLQQIILNLAMNARDAMPKGGVISFLTHSVNVNGDEIDFKPRLRPGEYVALTISDNGVGISKEIQSQILEPFFTTKPRGTGLGLSTVYGILESHRGAISLASEKDIGTSFTVYLPITSESKERPFIMERTGASSTKTILLVEDEPSVRELVKAILEENNYKVVAVCDGREAIKTLESTEIKIDLVLSDVVMPNLCGIELIGIVQKNFPQLKVILMSGCTQDEVITNDISQMNVPFLAKPFATEHLVKVIAEQFSPELRMAV